MSEVATPERLLTAAWTILRDDGLAAATSRRIAAAAGANLQAITYHYGSKDQLLARAVLAQLQSWTEPLTEALSKRNEDIDTYDTAVAAAIATIMGRLLADGADVDALLRLALSDIPPPDVRQAVTAWLRQLRGVAAAAMARQRRDGLVPDSVDPEAIAGVFTAFAIGLFAQAHLDPIAPAIPSLVQQFLTLLVRPET